MDSCCPGLQPFECTQSDESTMLDHSAMHLEHSCSTSFLTELEFSEEASFHHSSAKVVVRDAAVGAGGSVFVHLLVLLAAMLLPFMQTTLPPRECFVTVSLVEMAGVDRDFGDSGSLDGASGVVQRGVAPNAEAEEEKIASPEPPRTSKQVERVTAPSERATKRALSRPAPGPMPTQLTPGVAAKESPALPAPSSPNAAAEAAPTGPVGGIGEGAKGMGEGAGFSDRGCSSAGAGMHGGEFSVNTVDKIPQAVQKVEPVYPQKARKEGVCGRVVLKFVVEPDGRVSRPSVQEANPSGYFEQTALDAIRHWRFKPGIYRGKAVATWVILPIQFRLTN